MSVIVKMIPVETVPGIRGWGKWMKESSGGDEFKL
jgi:hypothetical protein